MAENKNTTATKAHETQMAQETQIAQETQAAQETQEAVKPVEKVKIRLRRATKGEDPYLLVGVNGKMWRIKRGETVEVPACVAEVINNAEAAEDEAQDFVQACAESFQRV